MATSTSRTKIVEQLNTEEELREQGVPRAIHFLQWTNIQIIEFLARNRLIRNTLNCDACRCARVFVVRSSSVDGFIWQCKRCGARKTIRVDSYFESDRIPLQTIMTIMGYWAFGQTIETIAREMNVSRNSVLKWGQKYRQVIQASRLQNPPILGGYNEDEEEFGVVELDETHLVKESSRPGREQKDQWLFAGIQRETGKCFIMEVPNNKATTLLPIIKKHVLPGTVIMTHASKAYENLANQDGGIYMHHIVGDKANIVSLQHPYIHTRGVERLWSSLKLLLRLRNGFHRQGFAEHLDEFAWRQETPTPELFTEFLIMVAITHRIPKSEIYN
ncbi:uncharacterized protein [Atheta coriaria]